MAVTSVQGVISTKKKSGAEEQEKYGHEMSSYKKLRLATRAGHGTAARVREHIYIRYIQHVAVMFIPPARIKQQGAILVRPPATHTPGLYICVAFLFCLRAPKIQKK